MLWFVLVGCGFIDAPGDPWVEAHRGAAGSWPQNSSTALLGSIEADFDGIEFDLVLTSDDVPVLSHDPWVDEDLCTDPGGAELTERVYIQDLNLESLETDYLCGGIEDPEFPEAEVVAEPIMTFDSLLEALQDASPDMVVHIDVKYEPGQTPEPDRFAEAILSRWWDSGLSQPMYVSANLPEATRAFENRADEEGLDLQTSLIWPRFTDETSDTVTALKSEFSSSMGVVDLVSLAASARADGLAIPYQLASRSEIRAARIEGLQVAIWTVNEASLLDTYAGWPIDALITDYPERATW
ncbi:MAG: glycerophosphodiester phosphodiesterase family protein [Myxococcota bacterium]|nr:glycerophosphodiester phosphodiesterase family protein [Myxococcota bacterium]